MVKEVKKGNKVPYHGYLLGISEYEKYQLFDKIAPHFLEYLQEETKQGKKKQCFE